MDSTDPDWNGLEAGVANNGQSAVQLIPHDHSLKCQGCFTLWTGNAIGYVIWSFSLLQLQIFLSDDFHLTIAFFANMIISGIEGIRVLQVARDNI